MSLNVTYKGCNTGIAGTIAFLVIMFLAVLLLAGNAGAATPVSQPGSRFVWTEDAGPTFNLTPLNFDGFYYDLDNNAGNEFLSIRLDSPVNRSIKENNIIYSTTIWNVPFKHRPFGNYSVIGLMGEKCFAGYTSGSRFAPSPVNLLNHSLLGKILVDDNEARTLIAGSNLTLNEEYALTVKDVNITAGTVQVVLEKHMYQVDDRIIKAGETYVYGKDIRTVKLGGGHYYDTKNITVGKLPIIAVHIDSVFADGETSSIVIKGIFQLSDIYISPDPVSGIMKITNITDTGITMRNGISSSLHRKDIEYIMGDIRLKVADSNNLRFHLYNETMLYAPSERRGAVYTGSNPVLAWDGLNFPGFWYDSDTGLYSEIMEITNLSGRRVPEGSIKYSVTGVETPFAFNRIKNTYFFNWDEIPGNDNFILIEFLKQNYGIDWVEKAYIDRLSNNIIKLYSGRNSLFLKLNNDKTKVSLEINNKVTHEFIAENENGKLYIYKTTKPYGVNSSFELFALGTDKYTAIKGKSSRLTRLLVDHGTEHDKKTLVVGETWEMGEGYEITLKDTSFYPGRAQLVLSKNGVELEDVWIIQGRVYTYIDKSQTEETGLPKFFTYLYTVFSGATVDMIVLRYTWLVSDNVTEIHVGDRFGKFRITEVYPDHLELRNERPINLSRGSRINLFGNLGFAAANSDELRFYPSNMIPQDVAPEVTHEEVIDTPVILARTADIMPSEPKRKTSGFEFISAITAFLELLLIKRNGSLQY